MNKVVSKIVNFGDYSSYEQNPELQLCLKEILRIHTSVPYMFGRIALKNIKLGKYTIYKGTRIFTVPGAWHSNEDDFKDAKKFKPERFSKEELSKNKPLHPLSFMPFGFGKRNCIGRYMAELMIGIIFTNAVKRFELHSLENWHTDIEQSLTYKPKQTYLRFKLRAQNK